MKRIRVTFLILFLLECAISHAQTIPNGLRSVEYEGAYNHILGMAASPDQKQLVISSYGGRFYLLNIENRVSKSAFDQGEKFVWKINLGGFKNGAKPIFTSDGKYILLKHVYEKENVTKYKPTACVVVEAATGTIVFDRKDGILSAAFASANSLVIATEQNLEWIDIPSTTKTKTIEMPQAEAIAINKTGSILAVSYIPTKAEFANLKSINNRRKEIKLAKKNKRLIEFFSLPDMQTISVVEDELDMVFRMKLTDDDKYLLYLSRARIGTNMLSKDDERQESNGGTLNANHVMRIDPQTGVLDRNFYYRTMYPNADFNVNNTYTRFGISTIDFIPNDFLGFKMGVQIYDYNNQDKLLASISTKFKLFKKYTVPYQFTFLNNQNQAYISINQNLYLWDMDVLNNYTFNQVNADVNDVIAAANTQLDSLSYTQDFKKQRAGIKLDGVYSYDITLVKKGQVLTVFSISDESTDIKGYNFLLNYVKAMKFENIKIEKDKRIKFSYDFNFED